MDPELRAILQKMIAREEERYERIEDIIYDFAHYLRKVNRYPKIPELMMEEPSDQMRLYYRIGPITYSPVLKNYRFVPIEFGRKQLRSKNGAFSSHILSFYRMGNVIKAVILNPECEKIVSQAEDYEVISEGDKFVYADTEIEILKIKEM